MPDIFATFDTSQMEELRKKAGEVNVMLQETVNEVMQSVFDLSQQLVPVKTGRLKGSGTLTLKEPNPRDDEIEASISYGDEDQIDYAVFVHEDLLADHKFPTQAKFLEIPLTRAEEEILPLIDKRLRGMLK